MARELTPNRWNWSQKDGKWVFIKINEYGEKIFYYKTEPPKEFRDLVLKIKNLNEKLILCKNSEENDRIFEQMVICSKKMQCMRLLE
jgi:hypothetical protein